MVGAAVVVLLAGVARLLRPTPHIVVEPTEEDLDEAARVIGGQTATSPNLVYLGDKALLFNGDRTGFVMYGVQGRTWVAMGDPVGPEAAVSGLIRAFLERCHDFGGVPVFYEVGPTHLHKYSDYGLTFVKLGEEAKVDLAAFTLDGAAGAKYRQAVRRLEKDGATFRVVPATEVPALMPELRAVSERLAPLQVGRREGLLVGIRSRTPTSGAFPWPWSSDKAAFRHSATYGWGHNRSSCPWP